MGFGNDLKQKALGFSQKAMERLFANEKRAEKIANAMGSVQRGKEAFDSTQTAVLHQFNFATQTDFKDLGKKVSRLKKRLKVIDEKVKGLTGSLNASAK
jgi:hypothetical protein